MVNDEVHLTKGTAYLYPESTQGCEGRRMKARRIKCHARLDLRRVYDDRGGWAGYVGAAVMIRFPNWKERNRGFTK